MKAWLSIAVVNQQINIQNINAHTTLFLEICSIPELHRANALKTIDSVDVNCKIGCTQHTKYGHTTESINYLHVS